MKFKCGILIISICFGLLSWLLDGIIDFLFFNKGTFLGSMIYDVPIHQFFMRFFIVVLFFLFGLIILNYFTKLKQTERALEKQKIELSRSNAELEQFAYVASHDLQEPLRMISSYVQLLARRYKDKLDEDANEFIEYAVDGATRMQKLINDLLAYSRIGTHGKTFKLTDCERALEQAVGNLEVSIRECRAVIEHDPLPTFICDGLQISQLFQNLINNAIKFRNEETPHIRICAKEKDNEWLFSVRDNGIGIDPKYAEHIFIIFQRLHDRSKYSGTGIGLAICKKIVERHGGSIWMESQPGKGTTFYFSIPKRREK